MSPALSLTSLAVPNVQSLDGGQQFIDETHAIQVSPAAVAARIRSRTAFRRLDAARAARVAREAFPQAIGHATGGLPPLPAGERIARYLSPNAAAIVLPGGGHGVVESLTPIARPKAAGGFTPLNLRLTDAGNAYVPASSTLGVRIPKQLASGVALPVTGVSLTPVDSRGAPLSGSQGSIDGAGVLYANTQTDTDTFIKPTLAGFEIDVLLRSPASQGELRFRVGMPSGAQLQQSSASGVVSVVQRGATLATVQPPVATDAAGSSVPVGMTIAGDTVVLTAPHDSDAYRYPIAVDPTLEVAKDEQLTGNSAPTNWHFCTSSLSCGTSIPPFRSSGWGGIEGLSDEASGEYKAGEFAELRYKTQGESKIFEATTTTEATNNEGDNIESRIELANESGTVNSEHLFSVSKNYSETFQLGSCSLGCPALENHNSLRYMQAASGSGDHFHNRISSASVRIEEEVTPTVTVDTTHQYLLGGKWLNVFYGQGAWLSEHQGAVGFTAEDKGIGVSLMQMAAGPNEVWFEENLLAKNRCSGVQCPQAPAEEEFTYNNKIANGEYYVSLIAQDAAMAYGEARVLLKVDGTSPSSLKVLGLPAGNVINEAPYHLVAQATDGSGTTVSSGIKSLALGIDGYELAGGKSGSCEPGPCTAMGEWTLAGEEFGAGKHTLTLVVTDNAGNVESRSYEITIRHAGPMAVGPGSVDPISGAFTLEAKDVSIGGGYGALGVSRGYESRALSAGAEGPLGPQWSLSISGEQGIESELSGGGVTLVATDGSRTTFTSDGKGGFVAPKGDENLKLTAEREGETVKAYVLSDPAKSTTVRFVHPSGASSSNLWVIEKAEGALSKSTGEKQTYSWEVLELEGKKIERPKQALAPAPPGVSCEPELKAGCRALSFSYATETKATGEAPSEWGEYNGRLAKVSFTAYNPVAKAMATTAVAEYSYDKQGRLRAEWDPRISPALKTAYGYDSEGHVVAVSPSGLEPWLLHYGTISSDSTAGRLLSAIRPPASTALASGPAPGNETKPTLSSTTPVIGTTLSVSSNGTWSNGPLAYDYQWQRCDANGEKCTAIPGAANQSYTPQARDAGYTLMATVTALNADGAGVASTAASSAIALVAAKYSLKFGTLGEGAGQLKKPAGAAIDGAGDVWVADHANNRLAEFTASGTFVEAVGWGVSNGESKLQVCTTSCRAGIAGPNNGQFSSPDGLAISEEDIYVADAVNNRIEVMNTKGEYVRSFGFKGSLPGELQNPVAVAIAQGANVWVADRGNNRIDEFTETGSYIGSFGTLGTGAGQFKEPSGIAFSGEYAYVVDAGNSRVEQLTLSGNYVGQFGSAGTGNGQFSGAAEIATEPVSGDLYVADSGNSRIEEFSPAGSFLVSVGSAGEVEGKFKGVEAIALTASGKLYAADLNNNRVQEFLPSYSTNNPAPAPPSMGSSAASTVEYQVPVSGTGAPYALGSTEVEAWAQKDDPTEATAVFPPDEPMGWPAQDYKRATIDYFDSYGRTVNTASPSGAIATAEYNETNNLVRTLSGANRATALKEGAKSAEVSKLLDTQSTYNAEGTELLETLGPRHTVKLSSGTEVLAREHVHNHYDEGAPEGETYDLLTKSSEGAEYEAKEADVRVTAYSYYGQENLGWLLRKPTMVWTDLTGLKLIHSTFYDPVSGHVIESRQPAAETGNWPAGQYVYSSQITTGGSAPSLKVPLDVSIDPFGNLWVADTNNSRIQEFAANGTYLRQFGSAGIGNGQFKEPHGVAADSKEDVWVADTVNNRVQELTSSGTYIRQFGSFGTGNGQFKAPDSIAVDSSGDVWVTDTGNSRVQEFSSTGVFIRQFGSAGTGNGQFKEPRGVAVEPAKGNVWVADAGNNRVQEFSSTGAYINQVGALGAGNGQFKAPRGIGFNTSEEMWVADTGNNRIQEFFTTGLYIRQFGVTGTNNGQFQSPTAVAVDLSGHVWVADSLNNRIQEHSVSGEYLKTAFVAAALKRPGAVAVFKETVWVANSEANRIEEFSSGREYLLGVGAAGTGTSQFKEPRGIAVDLAGHVWVADTGNNRVQEFSAKGEYIRQFGAAGTGNGQFKEPRGLAVDSKEDVWVADTGNNRMQEFSSAGEYIRQFGVAGTGNGQFKGPGGLAVDSKEDVWVADGGNNRVQEFSSAGEYIRQFGSMGKGNGQFLLPVGVAVDATGHVWVTDLFNTRVQEFTATGEYILQFGSAGSGNGQFVAPEGVAMDSSANAWVADAGANRVEKFVPTAAGFHASQTIYYSAGAGPEESVCGNHPEWVGLPCRSQPTLQPTKGNRLPVVTDTYNMWDEPETVTEEFGSSTRTKKSSYDAAGRLVTSEVTSTLDTALPAVTDEYSSETGAMVKQSTTVAEKTQAIASVYNRLGELTEYTDADANKTTYAYDVDGRVQEMNDVKGSQVYSYDPTTGTLTKLLDSAAGTFTASYDIEGRMTSETYPNGMSAKYLYNELGQPTHAEYVKESHCAGTCPEVWFGEGAAYSIHGEALSRSSTLASEAYTYDGAGRLTQVQETPTGKGCITRIYAYDADSSRLSLTTREPGAEGKCATSGGTVESHGYDEADRLTDAGVSFEAFGNATALPAADAGGHEVTSTYYVSNQTRSTTQNGETVTYNLDPEARSREVVSTGTTNSTVVNHYPGPGDAVSWIGEGGEKYTRDIPGIDGALSAVQQNGGTPVLQLHDMQGNIVATAALGETETKLLSTYNSTEFGVPTTSSPPKYSWLGAVGVTTEFSSGTTASMGAGYIPQLGAPLQTQAIVPPGAAPDGVYISPYISAVSAADLRSDAASAAQAPAREAARQQAAAEAAEEAAIDSATITDPEVSKYWSLSTAQQKAEEFLEVGNFGEILAVLGDLTGGLEEGAAKVLGKAIGDLGLSTALDWFHESGEKLMKCAHNHRHMTICRFTFDEWKVEPLGIELFEVPNLFSKPKVSECIPVPRVRYLCPYKVWVPKYSE